MSSEPNPVCDLSSPCARLVLGTAQLGMAYGVANRTGRPDASAATALMAAMWHHGVRFFDTAQAYGDSESALGRALAELGVSAQAKVITKLDLRPGDFDAKAVRQSVEGSLERLRVPGLWGLLLHREQLLDDWERGLGRNLAGLKADGLVGRFGVSIYAPERALQALGQEGLDLVQVPANVFDRQMERAGVFERARALGKSVFIRSVFLQGLALMPLEAVARTVPAAVEGVAAYARFCAERQLDRRRFALDYVGQMAPEARVIIGAETLEQAKEDCHLFQLPSLSPEVHSAWTALWPEDVGEVVDPRRWPTRAP
jgi:aryl-alcohol dehydrogenase-like predicted oxidoreductase